MSSSANEDDRDRVTESSVDRTEPVAPWAREALIDTVNARRRALIIHHHDHADVVLLSPERPVVVGRARPSDVVVPVRGVSRTHARFSLSGDEVTVEDLGSTNGTTVNGQRIEGVTTVPPGTDVTIGVAVISVLAMPAATEPGPPGEGPAEGAWEIDPDDLAAADEPVVAGAAMKAIFEDVAVVAQSMIPVLILGETGSGKEVVARAIHDQGQRRARPLISVNCGELVHDLVASAFFGHTRGAFSGAVDAKRGAFEAADGGTLLLDEIGELTLDAQKALLRVLATKRVTRVGSTQEIPVDVRLVAATHRDLRAMVAEGTFREDLLYRIEVMTLKVPPLRDRREEIAPLARRFLARANKEHGRRVRRIAAEAVDVLLAHAWPGNARELWNAIQRAVVIAKSDEIRVADLPDRLREAARTAAPGPARAARLLSADELRDRLLEVEANAILAALGETSGNVTEAARRMKMPLRTLVRKISALGLKGKY